MAAYIENRTLDITKSPVPNEHAAPIRVRRGETGATEIRATLKDNGAPFNVTGYTIKFKALLPNHDFTTLGGSIVTAASGIVSTTITSTLTAFEGPCIVAYFELTKSGVVLTSEAIPIIVLPDMDITAGQEGEYRNAIDQLMEELADAIDASEAATSSANSAASNANSAAKSANEAANKANNEASNAKDAAQKADAEAAAAEEAARKADEAAANADSCAQEVLDAVAEANASANRADDAAERANDAASELKGRADSGEFDGATFIPEVDTAGFIAWTNDKGLENPQTRYIRGPQGYGLNPPKGRFESIEELLRQHPDGVPGDSYLVDDDLIVWIDDEGAWENIGPIAWQMEEMDPNDIDRVFEEVKGR